MKYLSAAGTIFLLFVLAGCAATEEGVGRDDTVIWGHTGVVYDRPISRSGGGGAATAVVGFETVPDRGVGFGVEAAGYSGG